MTRLHIKGAALVSDGDNAGSTDLYLADGRIAGAGKAPDGFQPDRTIDASGKGDHWILPGIIDLACQLESPDGTIAAQRERRAAAAGGITDIAVASSTATALNAPALIENLHEVGETSPGCRIHVIADALDADGSGLGEMQRLKQAGARAVVLPSQALNDRLLVQRAMQYAHTLDLTLFVQPTDPSLSAGGCAHEGAVATRLGLPGIPVAAETTAIAMLASLVEHTGARLHLCRLSSAAGVNRLREARAQGLPITADVAISHLLYSHERLLGFDAAAHLLPPLRSDADRKALLAAVNDRSIDAVCSNHQPLGRDAKINPFPSTLPGSANCELLLPFLFDCMTRGEISRSALLESLTIAPATILGLEPVSLEAGSVADLCMLNSGHTSVVHADDLISDGSTTVFEGAATNTQVQTTLCRGQVIFEQD